MSQYPAAEPGSGPGEGAELLAEGARLLAEAATRSDLVWIRPVGQQRAWPAWHVWHEGAVHVVSGPGEQELPALDGAVELVVRSKDTWALLLTVPAAAETLPPDDERWLPAAQALAASRLNATTPPAQLPEQWRGRATVTRIASSGALAQRPGHYNQDSGAAAPPPSPATTSGRRPWHLGGRWRRARAQALRRARDR